jgi:hypothetical protein
MRMFRFARALALGVSLFGFASAAEAQFQRIEWFEQGWTAAQRNQFYATSQGSQLLPYYWFVNLERKDSTASFIDDGLARYGYLAQPKAAGNPHGLPVGFIPDTGKNGLWVGLNCSACHTNRMTVKGRTFQIDGAPGGGDLQSFLEDLVGAMQATVKDPAKLERLFVKIAPHVGAAVSANDGALFKRQFRARTQSMVEFMGKSFEKSHGAERWGPMRTDAFGMIFNRLAGVDLGDPRNVLAANAPVSYPFLWTTNRQTIVQWPGLVPDNENPIVRLGRNAGQVVGVFGAVPNLGKANIDENTRFAASMRIGNLGDLGTLIGSWGLLSGNVDTLDAPRWPADKNLGPEFAINRTLAIQGKEIYTRLNCAQCHAPLGRSGQNIVSVMTPVSELGTDPLTANNARSHSSYPGALASYLKQPPRPGERVPTATLLEAAVPRIVLFNLLGPDADSPLGAQRGVAAAVGTPTLRQSATAATATGGKTAYSGGTTDAPSYKGGPMSGIWATSPYLHNGSVPDLEALFLPSRCAPGAPPDTCRPARFAVGNREFDPRRVGFTREPGPGSWIFDTTRLGNSNAGHEGRAYGTELSSADRRALIEYLKVIDQPGF